MKVTQLMGCLLAAFPGSSKCNLGIFLPWTAYPAVLLFDAYSPQQPLSFANIRTTLSVHAAFLSPRLVPRTYTSDSLSTFGEIRTFIVLMNLIWWPKPSWRKCCMLAKQHHTFYSSLMLSWNSHWMNSLQLRRNVVTGVPARLTSDSDMTWLLTPTPLVSKTKLNLAVNLKGRKELSWVWFLKFCLRSTCERNLSWEFLCASSSEPWWHCISDFWVGSLFNNKIMLGKSH